MYAKGGQHDGRSLIWQPAIYLANKFSLSLSLSLSLRVGVVECQLIAVRHLCKLLYVSVNVTLGTISLLVTDQRCSINSREMVPRVSLTYLQNGACPTGVLNVKRSIAIE